MLLECIKDVIMKNADTREELGRAATKGNQYKVIDDTESKEYNLVQIIDDLGAEHVIGFTNDDGVFDIDMDDNKFFKEHFKILK